MVHYKTVLQQEKPFWIVTNKQCQYVNQHNSTMFSPDFENYYYYKTAAKLFGLPCRLFKTLFNWQSTMLLGTSHDE